MMLASHICLPQSSQPARRHHNERISAHLQALTPSPSHFLLFRRQRSQLLRMVVAARLAPIRATPVLLLFTSPLLLLSTLNVAPARAAPSSAPTSPSQVELSAGVLDIQITTPAISRLEKDDSTLCLSFLASLFWSAYVQLCREQKYKYRGDFHKKPLLFA